MTVSQINALGERLRKSSRPSAADFSRLNDLQGDYLAPMIHVQRSLRQRLGLGVHARLKNPHTVVEKLVRDRTRLSKMQDIAGVRVVEDLDLMEQDDLGERIGNVLGGAVRVYDRRRDPRYGYRAVHIVVQIDDCPVEIQIRTRLQDAWANAMEIVADRVGRFVRYEPPPANTANGETAALVDDMARDSSDDEMSIADIVRILYRWSTVIATLEMAQTQAAEFAGSFDRMWPTPPAEADDDYVQFTEALEQRRRYTEDLPSLKEEVLTSLDDLAAALKGVAQ